MINHTDIKNNKTNIVNTDDFVNKSNLVDTVILKCLNCNRVDSNYNKIDSYSDKTSTTVF